MCALAPKSGTSTHSPTHWSCRSEQAGPGQRVEHTRYALPPAHIPTPRTSIHLVPVETCSRRTKDRSLTKIVTDFPHPQCLLPTIFWSSRCHRHTARARRASGMERLRAADTTAVPPDNTQGGQECVRDRDCQCRTPAVMARAGWSVHAPFGRSSVARRDGIQENGSCRDVIRQYAGQSERESDQSERHLSLSSQSQARDADADLAKRSQRVARSLLNDGGGTRARVDLAFDYPPLASSLLSPLPSPPFPPRPCSKCVPSLPSLL